MTRTVRESQQQWLIPFAVQLIPAGILLFGSLMLKETPRWLFTKGRIEEGIANLCWIRNLKAEDTYIVEEITMMEQQIYDLPQGFFLPIKEAFQDRKIRWRLFLGHSLFILQNFAGVNAINYYSPGLYSSCSQPIRWKLTLSRYLQIGRHQQPRHDLPHHWPLRSRQDRHHSRMASRLDRQIGTPPTSPLRSYWRLNFHVHHRCSHHCESSL